MELGAGVLVANPIPADAEIPREEIEPAIAAALQEAQRRRIEGKAVTPFLLERVLEGTQGRSLDANIALARNNARLAAEIAVALAASSAEGGEDMGEKKPGGLGEQGKGTNPSGGGVGGGGKVAPAGGKSKPPQGKPRPK